MSLIPRITPTTADLLIDYYKAPKDVQLPPELNDIAAQVSQIKQLFAEKWKKRDIVEHLMEAWGIAQKTAYDRIDLATKCFPDLTVEYIDMEIQLLLDFQKDMMNAYYDYDPKVMLGVIKERRLLLTHLRNRFDGKNGSQGSITTVNYIYIQNNSGQPTKVREDELATLDIDARNLLLKKASNNLLPKEFDKLLPKEE